jgi:hypothetical protein
MKHLIAAVAVTVVVGLSGQAMAATSANVAPSATSSIKANGGTKAPVLLANRGGGSGNDVWPNQRPSYLS